MMKFLFRIPFDFLRGYRGRLFPVYATVLLVSLLAMNVSASVYSQRKLTLSKTKYSIEELFVEVKQQTGLTAIYSNDRLNKRDKVQLPSSTIDLDNLLDFVLTTRALTYEFKDEYIIIKPQLVLASPVAKASVNAKVTGTVTDDAGNPLPGVSVVVKGTTTGVISDFDGKFTLDVPSRKGLVLVFSFVGMATQEINVGAEGEINVRLLAATAMINEVVVTGYQKIDRRLFTGSASKLSNAEIKLDATPDVSKFLQGQVSGVSVDNVSGTYGAAPVVRIRGNASINGNNKPLWVVDGVILEDLVAVSADDLTSGNLATVLSSGVAGLNPDDIEDIQVLKDASATALYGAQAMNGVIVINTKKGVAGKLQVAYSGNVTIKERPTYSQFDIANSATEMSYYKELYRKGWVDLTSSVRSKDYGVMGKMFNGIAEGTLDWGTDGSLNEDFLSKYANANTDWFDLLFKNSVTQQHSFSFTGGTEKANYYASVSMYDDAGTTIADNVRKYTASLNANYELNSKLSVGLKFSINHRSQKLPGSKDRDFNPVDGVYTRDFDINPFSYALNTARSMRAYDDNGNLEYFRRDYSDFNILYELEHNSVQLTASDMVAQANIDYKITKDLVFSSIAQVRRSTALREHKIHESSNQANAYRAASTQYIMDANQLLFHDPDQPNGDPFTILPSGGFYNTVNNALDFYSVRTSVAWNPHIEDTHLMSFLVGQEIKYTDRLEASNDGWGIQYDRGGLYAEDPYLSKYLSLNNQKRSTYEPLSDRYVGYFLNGAYSYKGKYTVNATLRRDGSNQLGRTSAARYLTSWNVSGKWNIKDEEFMKGIEFLDLLSLKATYGLNGVMGPSASAVQKLEAYQTWRAFDKETGVNIVDLNNNDLSWEKMYEFSLGIEAAFFGNRIYTDMAYYKRNSFDLVGEVRTSGIGGIGIKYGNFANMETQGFEFALNTTNLKTKDFKWTSNLNLDYNTNTVTKLDNYDRIGDYVRNTGGNFVGQARRGLYSFRFAGLTKQGLPSFIDSNGDPIEENVNLQERKDVMKYIKYEGVLDAPLSGGLTNSFTYKDFSFSFGFVFRAGNVIRLDDLFSSSYTGYTSLSRDMENRWIVPGDELLTNVPTIVDRRFNRDLDAQDLNLYEMYNKSDVRVADGSFLRLKTISLGYNIPVQASNILGVHSARVSLQVQNVLLLYSDKKLNGLDPEFYRSGGVALPTPRTYSFSVNIGF